MASKEETIAKVYHDPAGYGSIKATLKDARAHDPTINEEDVKRWLRTKEVGLNKKPRGMNSFVASGPREEYQMDLLFFPEAPANKGTALLMVDIFTKYTQVVMIASKQVPDVSAGIMEAMGKMGGKPKTIYADQEGAWTSTLILKYFEEQGIRFLMTQTHAPVAERQIRTIKNMIYPRTAKTRQGWWEVIDQVLITYNYKMVHSVTKMTPNEARHPASSLTVKFNLEMKRRNTRTYPAIDVGDRVRIFKKKDKLDKERVSNWLPTIFVVAAIEEDEGQKFYKLVGRPKVLMRHELLLVG